MSLCNLFEVKFRENQDIRKFCVWFSLENLRKSYEKIINFQYTLVFILKVFSHLLQLIPKN